MSKQIILNRVKLLWSNNPVRLTLAHMKSKSRKNRRSSPPHKLKNSKLPRQMLVALVVTTCSTLCLTWSQERRKSLSLRGKRQLWNGRKPPVSNVDESYSKWRTIRQESSISTPRWRLRCCQIVLSQYLRSSQLLKRHVVTSRQKSWNKRRPSSHMLCERQRRRRRRPKAHNVTF